MFKAPAFHILFVCNAINSKESLGKNMFWKMTFKICLAKQK